SPPQRHRHAQRKLVGRSDVSSPRSPAEPETGADIHAVLVDRHGDDSRCNGSERDAGPEVARVLHPYGLAGAQQYSRDQIERLLVSGHEEDLLRAATDPARDGEIV